MRPVVNHHTLAAPGSERQLRNGGPPGGGGRGPGDFHENSSPGGEFSWKSGAGSGGRRVWERNMDQMDRPDWMDTIEGRDQLAALRRPTKRWNRARL